MLSIIVTVDRNWAISNEHKPLISIPDDIKFVKDTTYGQVVIMGKHTFENYFNAKPLPNRTTIIVTKDPDVKIQGAIVVHSSTQAMLAAEKYNKDIYILGGKDCITICFPCAMRSMLLMLNIFTEPIRFSRIWTKNRTGCW